MKAFIDEYGTTCVVVLVVVTLIGFITIFKAPLQGYYEQILDSFFNRAMDATSFIENIGNIL